MSRHVLILGLDGSLPNLALMRVSGHHKSLGDVVEFRVVRHEQQFERTLFDAPYERVYAGLIFEKTRPLAKKLLQVYPNAIVGGTGWDCSTTLASVGIPEDSDPDYSVYPNFSHSIGFTQRGCRLKCSFCVVPRKEGSIVVADTVWGIYRGENGPKNLVLLDNDFFGSPLWRFHLWAIRSGGFKVNFNQGINARFLTKETAEAIASVDYYDADFRKRRLYTAWDNRKDEERLFAGLNHLKEAGVPPSRIMVYVLVGYDHATKTPRGVITEDDVYRVKRLREWGADPYPMPFVRTADTKGFQKWVCRFQEKIGVPWEKFRAAGYESRRMIANFGGED